MFSLPYYYPGRKKKVLKEDGDTAIAHVYAVLHQMLFYFLLLLRCCSRFLCSAVFISLFRLDLHNLAVLAVAGLSGDLLISSDLEVIGFTLLLSATVTFTVLPVFAVATALKPLDFLVER